MLTSRGKNKVNQTTSSNYPCEFKGLQKEDCIKRGGFISAKKQHGNHGHLITMDNNHEFKDIKC